MQLLAYLLLCILANWRLTFDIVREDGPFDLYRKFREWVAYSEWLPGWAQKGFSCLYCVSFWMGWIVAAPLWPLVQPSEYILLSLASGGALTLYMRYMTAMYQIEI